MASIPDLDAIARKYDTKRWPSVVHMNGRLLAPKETPEDVAALVAEVRAARKLRDQLVEFHDSYDSGTDDRFKVRGRIYRFLAEYDAQRG